MHLEHHLVGGYVRYISSHIIIIINSLCVVSLLFYTGSFLKKGERRLHEIRIMNIWNTIFTDRPIHFCLP